MPESQLMAPRTYGNWRKPTSPGLFGLGSAGTALMLGGLIFMVIIIAVAGFWRGLIVSVLLGLVLLAIVRRDKHGKSMLDRGIARGAWLTARRRGAHLYRSGPLGLALWGTHQLPGLAASLRVTEHQDSYGRPFVLVYAPSTSTYAVVLSTEPEGASLVDQEQVDVWVADWGHWLAALGDEPGVEAAAVTIETAPDTGHRLRREVRNNIDPSGPAFAREMLANVVELHPAGSNIIKGYVTITFSAESSSTGKKRSALEMGRDVAARLPGLTGSLSATGAGAVRPMAAAELCEVVRTAYSPAMGEVVEEAHAQDEETDLTWDDVGPAAAEAEWGGYRHDEAYSISYSMTTAPRGNVHSMVLARLLAPHRDVARKRVTLLYRPIDAARAAAIVESDLRAAEFLATSSTKPKARAVIATRSAAATASEEATGAGLVNFGMIVTATVTDHEKISEAKAAIDNLSATARLRLRPVYGAQDAAFAAALPLGLVLPKHIKGPATLRSKL